MCRVSRYLTRHLGLAHLAFIHNVYIVTVALLVGRSQDRFPVVSLVIFSVVPSDKTMCSEVDSASENEYQGFLLR
jgi:hypothetical protein